jgi:hypothetical protein
MFQKNILPLSSGLVSASPHGVTTKNVKIYSYNGSLILNTNVLLQVCNKEVVVLS